METRREAADYCLTLGNVYEDYPFDDRNWTVMRHRENKKVFAWIFEREGRIWINVKGRPSELDFFRRVYESVVPAYHLNKEHWNSVILDGGVPDAEVCRMIEESWKLTLPKRMLKEMSFGVDEERITWYNGNDLKSGQEANRRRGASGREGSAPHFENQK